MRRHLVITIGAISPLVLLATACETRSEAETPPTTAAATTTVAPTTTVPLIPLAKPLRQGARGDEVKLVQERLLALHFDPGAADGVFDTPMTQAVWAFQKLVGVPADGVVTPDLWTQMQQPFIPAPMVPLGEAD